MPFYQLFPPKGQGRRKVLKAFLLHTSDQNAAFPELHKFCFLCVPAPLFQTQPRILSHCHAPLLELQNPVPKPAPALTRTEHCILLNHFGDISIRVDTEITGALERWKTKGKGNVRAHQHQRAVEPG